MQHKSKLIKRVSLIVMAATVVIIAIGYMKPGPNPGYKCAQPGERASLFLDKTQGDCKITVDSFNAVTQWNKGIYGEARVIINRTCGILFLLSLVGLITGTVMGIQHKRAQRRR